MEKEVNFKHGNIEIRQTWSAIGKHVEVMLKTDSRYELLSTADPRAKEAFIALHNAKCEGGGI